MKLHTFMLAAYVSTAALADSLTRVGMNIGSYRESPKAQQISFGALTEASKAEIFQSIKPTLTQRGGVVSQFASFEFAGSDAALVVPKYMEHGKRIIQHLEGQHYLVDGGSSAGSYVIEAAQGTASLPEGAMLHGPFLPGGTYEYTTITGASRRVVKMVQPPEQEPTYDAWVATVQLGTSFKFAKTTTIECPACQGSRIVQSPDPRRRAGMIRTPCPDCQPTGKVRRAIAYILVP